MARDPWFEPSFVEGIEYVPQRVFCGRCGVEHRDRTTKFWWCGVDRWCCHECQTPQDWSSTRGDADQDPKDP
jgi:hypothetical protein